MELSEKIRLYIKLIRVYQWTKNGFVFLPFVFAQEAIDLALSPFSESSKLLFFKLLISFFAFSFLASSVYVLNDWKDRNLDRLDPKKRYRPIASGKVTKNEAIVIFFVLFFLSFTLAGLLRSQFAIYLLLFYFLMNIAYSYGAKKVLLLDVFLIAVGFVIRVLFGAFAINIPASPWLISTTFFIALFLGFYKRYFEVLSVPAEKMIGGMYHRESLRSFIDISAGLAIMTYSLYTITGTHAESNLYWTIPFVVIGIFRYYTLIENPENKEGNPADVLLTDPFLIFVIILWLVSCYGLILYHYLTK
ncbi:MAG: UbiA prenyltransferase family protein [Leptospiraceae bacterium]|nr:UbiA prenyltransferase family protein [Leptospiraceae bacterium]MDW7977138.1 UbiA prenyltransferase family protein [Leptospiraceae bacterium]